MPNEKTDKPTTEKASEPAEEGGTERPIGRERREMEGGDPRIGRGGAPVAATEDEDKKDTGDGAATGRV